MKVVKIQELLEKSQVTIKDALSQYVSNPNHDFIRNRKLPFEKIIYSILSLEGRSLNNELLYQSGCAINTPTSSAFIQQRNKISYKAFESLFHDLIKNDKRRRSLAKSVFAKINFRSTD